MPLPPAFKTAHLATSKRNETAKNNFLTERQVGIAVTRVSGTPGSTFYHSGTPPGVHLAYLPCGRSADALPFQPQPLIAPASVSKQETRWHVGGVKQSHAQTSAAIFIVGWVRVKSTAPIAPASLSPGPCTGKPHSGLASDGKLLSPPVV